MAAVTICSDFGAQENKICHCSTFSPIYLPWKWWDWMPWSSVFESWVLSQLFHSLLSPSSRGSLVPLQFLPLGWCHLHIDISPSNLDSSLCFIQPSILHDELCILGFPASSAGKESACNARDPCSIPWSGRYPGEGIGYPLQYFGASLVAHW